MIKEKIILVSETQTSDEKSENIPEWVRNNADWWVSGQIDDGTFVDGIEYLISAGIIVIE